MRGHEVVKYSFIIPLTGDFSIEIYGHVHVSFFYPTIRFTRNLQREFWRLEVSFLYVTHLVVNRFSLDVYFCNACKLIGEGGRHF